MSLKYSSDALIRYGLCLGRAQEENFLVKLLRAKKKIYVLLGLVSFWSPAIERQLTIRRVYQFTVLQYIEGLSFLSNIMAFDRGGRGGRGAPRGGRGGRGGFGGNARGARGGFGGGDRGSRSGAHGMSHTPATLIVFTSNVF